MSDAPARTDLIGGLEHEVSVMIRRVRRVIGARSRAVHPDLQIASYLMLSYLADRGPTRASAMVEALGVDKGAISRQVQHLVDLGLVERSPDPDDGRATLVTASKDAMSRLAAIKGERRQWMDAQLSDWSESQLSDFITMLGRYNDALDAS